MNVRKRLMNVVKAAKTTMVHMSVVVLVDMNWISVENFATVNIREHIIITCHAYVSFLLLRH